MQVVVVGGGYAGVSLLRRLEENLPEPVELIVIDESGHHTIQHQLHRLLRYPELDIHLRIPLDELLTRTEIIEAAATKIDIDNRSVEIANNQQFNPDILVLCHGAITADHGIPGVNEYGQPFKRIAHAKTVRNEFDTIQDGGQVIIGGAGLSGIQVAGELAAGASKRDTEIDVILVERESTVAPTFEDQFSRTVREALQDYGVTILTERRLVKATSDQVEFDTHESLAHDQFIWTGGITGPSVLDGNRPIARADLQLAPGVFGAGDAVRVVDNTGASVPASAQTAIREARTVASNIEAIVSAEYHSASGMPPHVDRYEFSTPGWVVSVGDDAVATVGGTVLRGNAAKLIKTGIGAGYLASIGRYRSSLIAIRKSVGWTEHV